MSATVFEALRGRHHGSLRQRSMLVGLAVVAVIAAAFVGYRLGASQTVEIDTAQQAGTAAGARRGAAVGAREGFAVGFRSARERAYRVAYSRAFRRAYIEQFRNADLPTPENVTVRAP